MSKAISACSFLKPTNRYLNSVTFLPYAYLAFVSYALLCFVTNASLYARTAVTAISTFAFFGSAATWNAALAGYGAAKNSA